MYDITKIFQEIENQLISSMCRNLSRHIDEEQEADVNYPQWQTKQLQALERYRKENLKEFSKQFEDINNGLKKYLEMIYNNSKTATEHDIISNLDKNSDAIGVNQEKLNALIKSVTDDFQKAEYSLLRRSNDLYRQTIYKAQVGLNTGSITLNQAIDMATKDFLSNGINSIRYKNGNLVNIASYSEMALRTAEKRATMYGDGEKCQEWDIDTVVVYGHNGACPLCSRWQNRVYIDDVYSNGKPNNKYPLLSVAIQGGLYHPNCKCPPPQTYIEGITEPPTQKAPQELEKDIQNYNLEQVQRYNERQIRKYKRLEANSLDDANKKRYSLKVKEWQSKQREFINTHPETLRRDYSREKVRVLNITEPPKNATDITPIAKSSLTFSNSNGKINPEDTSNKFDFNIRPLGENAKEFQYTYLEQYRNTSPKYIEALTYRFNNGSEKMQSLFLNYVPYNSVAISNLPIGETPKFSPKTKKIYMNFLVDYMKNGDGNGIGARYFHEHGHLIDNALGNISINNKSFLENLKKDFRNLIKKVQNDKNLSVKEVNEIIRQTILNPRTDNGISDVIHGLSYENIVGCATHPKTESGSYWNKNTIPQEAFAHMFETQFDKAKYDKMKDFFPTALKEFEDMLEEYY
jgi:hypothetical protein